MQTPNEPYTIYDRGWVVRIQAPSSPPPHRVMLMLHGWTGDENVMWVFARNLPPDYLILAPRGPVKAPERGYGWAVVREGKPQTYDEYTEALSKLMPAVDAWLRELNAAPQPLNLMGFSQGAAAIYTLLISQPERVARLAALSGFIPQGAKEQIIPGSLEGKAVFIAHGTKDETVPVSLARQSAEVLEAAGANVTYCEDDVGHKLGASCHKGLAAFFK